MDDLLLHIRVSRKLKEQIQVLIDAGYFNNQTEVVREGIRDTLLKYKDELPHNGSGKKKRE
ncbi:ribbon-helix-helix domain-containing protein [Nanoarchaeota archaeon]